MKKYSMWLFYVLALISALSSIPNTLCDVEIIINEINSNTLQKLELLEFVELHCFKGSNEGIVPAPMESLNKYKILIVSGYDDKIKSATIEMVANLWSKKCNNHGFFVLGGSQV